jgi:RNA polymerase sigma-70 factor (ECF subfamily)
MSSSGPDDSLEVLLARLRQGDIAAAEQVFIAYEPYLRLFVRRQLSAELRAKFDSVDVVQSVWADLLRRFRATQWQFCDAGHLRAFLVKVTHHRFIDLVRKHLKAIQHEQPLESTPEDELPPARQTEPTEKLLAAEVWERLLVLCPPQHRYLLELKRRGYGFGEIAARTGLHVGSVRRILYELARRYALRDPDRRTALDEEE